MVMVRSLSYVRAIHSIWVVARPPRAEKQLPRRNGITAPANGIKLKKGNIHQLDLLRSGTSRTKRYVAKPSTLMKLVRKWKTWLLFWKWKSRWSCAPFSFFFIHSAYVVEENWVTFDLIFLKWGKELWMWWWW